MRKRMENSQSAEQEKRRNLRDPGRGPQSTGRSTGRSTDRATEGRGMTTMSPPTRIEGTAGQPPQRLGEAGTP